MRNAKSVTLSSDHIRDVDLLSRIEGVSFSNMVDRILQDYLRRPDVRERLADAARVLAPVQEET